MKELTTVLIVILTIVLGRWILTFEGLALKILMRIYSMFFVGVFGYGIYKILEYFEKN